MEESKKIIGLEFEVDGLKQKILLLEEVNNSLKIKVDRLIIFLGISIGILTIFGIAGTWGWSILKAANLELTALNDSVENLNNEIFKFIEIRIDEEEKFSNYIEKKSKEARNKHSEILTSYNSQLAEVSKQRIQDIYDGHMGEVTFRKIQVVDQHGRKFVEISADEYAGGAVKIFHTTGLEEIAYLGSSGGYSNGLLRLNSDGNIRIISLSTEKPSISLHDKNQKKVLEINNQADN